MPEIFRRRSREREAMRAPKATTEPRCMVAARLISAMERPGMIMGRPPHSNRSRGAVSRKP